MIRQTKTPQLQYCGVLFAFRSGLLFDYLDCGKINDIHGPCIVTFDAVAYDSDGCRILNVYVVAVLDHFLEDLVIVLNLLCFVLLCGDELEELVDSGVGVVEEVLGTVGCIAA